MVSVPRALIIFKDIHPLAYHLRKIQATRDPFYLDVGDRVLHDLIARAKVDCGLTGIQDLRTNKQDDRMESFVLSETLKVSLF